ncbi:hypothetical protein Ddye_029113 [Dipteronia dyeriana]|uniref:NAD(P)H dehydrogenase (quinone) n=1 Tax=Dipteronia dyeriana TaxID=168575 RepID=A0AAD9WKC2_9ROSI|nr:hypothetical protein Ddye_029113 [Dipteronia dyeriana]
MEVMKKEDEVEMAIEYIEISTLPMLNTDLLLGYGDFPPVVEDFRRKILEADCFLFASPEYNYSVTGRAGNSGSWVGLTSTRHDPNRINHQPDTTRLIKWVNRLKPNTIRINTRVKRVDP